MNSPWHEPCRVRECQGHCRCLRCSVAILTNSSCKTGFCTRALPEKPHEEWQLETQDGARHWRGWLSWVSLMPQPASRWSSCRLPGQFSEWESDEHSESAFLIALH